MNTYRVVIERTVTERCTIDVEAHSLGEAARIAERYPWATTSLDRRRLTIVREFDRDGAEIGHVVTNITAR